MYDLQKMKERIKDLKNQQNLTNSQLAELSGIPVGTLNKMLGSETKDPQISTIIKIAKALGVSADYIILGSNTNDETPGILIKYNKLNSIGQQKAIDYIEDLLENSKYTDKNKSFPIDIAEELKQDSVRINVNTK